MRHWLLLVFILSFMAGILSGDHNKIEEGSHLTVDEKGAQYGDNTNAPSLNPYKDDKALPSHYPVKVEVQEKKSAKSYKDQKSLKLFFDYIDSNENVLLDVIESDDTISKEILGPEPGEFFSSENVFDKAVINDREFVSNIPYLMALNINEDPQETSVYKFRFSYKLKEKYVKANCAPSLLDFAIAGGNKDDPFRLKHVRFSTNVTSKGQEIEFSIDGASFEKAEKPLLWIKCEVDDESVSGSANLFALLKVKNNPASELENFPFVNLPDYALAEFHPTYPEHAAKIFQKLFYEPYTESAQSLVKSFEILGKNMEMEKMHYPFSPVYIWDMGEKIDMDFKIVPEESLKNYKLSVATIAYYKGMDSAEVSKIYKCESQACLRKRFATKKLFSKFFENENPEKILEMKFSFSSGRKNTCWSVIFIIKPKDEKDKMSSLFLS